jgi:hypothetical protein
MTTSDINIADRALILIYHPTRRSPSPQNGMVNNTLQTHRIYAVQRHNPSGGQEIPATGHHPRPIQPGVCVDEFSKKSAVIDKKPPTQRISY